MASADLDETDIEAVVGVLRSGRLALGNQTPCSSGASRSMSACGTLSPSAPARRRCILIALALDLGPGDEVLVPSFTFAASVNAILFVGATPVFVDILTDTYSLDPADMERKITPYPRRDGRGCVRTPRGVDAILALAERHGLKVIDDSCEALGATYKGARSAVSEMRRPSPSIPTSN